MPEVNDLAMTTSIPQVTTGNLCHPVGRAEEEELNPIVQVFPNPTSGRVDLFLSHAQTKGALDVDLFDGQGRKLQGLIMRKGVEELGIDLSEYASGLYWLRISREGELLKVKKVIRE